MKSSPRNFTARTMRISSTGSGRCRIAGQIEVLTSAATHGYFPLLGRDESIRHQVRQGRHTYRKYFGRDPNGFWLPECAYRPGLRLEAPLRRPAPLIPAGAWMRSWVRKGIGYFFVDGHLLKGGDAKGVYIDRFPALKRLWEELPGRLPAGPRIRPETPIRPTGPTPRIRRSSSATRFREPRSGAANGLSGRRLVPRIP